MDGGGFSQSEAAPQRAKGVTPMSGDFICRSSGQGESSAVDLQGYGPQKIGRLVKYLGIFKENEDLGSHFVATIKDNTTEGSVGVKCIISGKNENNKSSTVEFDGSIADSYKNHHVSIVGYITDNIDHGRVLNVVKMNLVKSPWEYLAHQLEVAYQIKLWKSGGAGAGIKSEGMGGGFGQKANDGSGNLRQRIMEIICQVGENESWGCDKKTLYASFSDVDKSKIDNFVNMLLDEGSIYNTLDDDHFKSSDQQ